MTHDQEEALAVSDRIIVMNNAVIAQDGTPRDLYDAPISSFVADFIGEANLLSCDIIKVADGIQTVTLGPVKLSLPANGFDLGPAKLAIRPNRITIVEAGKPNSLPAVLRKITYIGKHLECLAETESGPIFVICNDVNASICAGDSVGLHFPERGPVLVKD